jgi:hypothetical protein
LVVKELDKLLAGKVHEHIALDLAEEDGSTKLINFVRLNNLYPI